MSEVRYRPLASEPVIFTHTDYTGIKHIIMLLPGEPSGSPGVTGELGTRYVFILAAAVYACFCVRVRIHDRD